MAEKITHEWLQATTAVRGQRIERMDSQCRGLQIRISEGAKTFAFVHRPKGGKPIKLTLGHYPDMSLSAARKLADKHRVAAAADRDVRAEDQAKRHARAAAQVTFKELADDFVRLHCKVKKRSWEADERQLAHFVDGWPDKAGTKRLPAWGRRAVTTISRAEIATALSTIAEDAPISANRHQASLSKMFRWAVSEGRLTDNPMAGLAKREDESGRARERALSTEELKAFWRELTNPDSPIGSTTRAALRFILLTGQRPGEVAGMMVDELDLTEGAATWTIPAARSKNKRKHAVPLTPAALAIITAELEGRENAVAVFRSRTFGDRPMNRHSLPHACADTAKALGVPHFVAHDLRRTAATIMRAAGVAPHAVESVLNHLPPALVRVYQTHDPLPERRAALETLAAEINRFTET